jgi:hypothetical protein
MYRPRQHPRTSAVSDDGARQAAVPDGSDEIDRQSRMAADEEDGQRQYRTTAPDRQQFRTVVTDRRLGSDEIDLGAGSRGARVWHH